MGDQREPFEPYPFEADATSPAAPDDLRIFRGAVEEQNRTADRVGPGPTASPPPSRMGRRGLIAGAAAVLGLGAAGLLGLRANSSATTVLEEPPVEAEPDPGEEGESGYAVLETSQTSVEVEVPAGWTIDDEGPLLVLGHPSGRLAARSPERASARRADLAREADYLREGFEPAGEPQVSDESTTRYGVLVQQTAGRLGGSPATETVTLVTDAELGTALVVSRVTSDQDRQATLEARTIESQLRRGFEDG
ncbi:MAG: hypothetical protein REI45_14260 [Propionicimonas sp.]|nr:hypothetical protein [Propionicimonas sp.]